MGDQTPNSSNPPNLTLKLCTINICGLSNRSRFVMNRYIDEEKIDILAIQETGSSDTLKLELDNMSCICDTNNAGNKGAALYVNNKYSIAKIDSLSKLSKNIDSCWGLVVIQNKRYLIGNVYVKLDYKPAINEVLRMLNAARQRQTELKASGIILKGDFNARHCAWGDTNNNEYGKSLIESLDHTQYSICTSNTPTFLCANGSSVIDFSIISNNLVDSVVNCRTDDSVELFSGAPSRGHLPLITEIATHQVENNEIKEKLDITKINWNNWTKSIEDAIEVNRASLESEDNPYSLWNAVNSIISKATDKHGETKKCCKHSKPYWTSSLTTLSKDLQAARKSYIKRNTDRNLLKLNEAKAKFDDERKSACQEFLISKAKKLNAVQSQNFWKDFNKLFTKKSVHKIDPLNDGNGGLLTDHKDMENCLFSVFFEAKHLIDGDFDDEFYTEVNHLYDEIINQDLEEATPHDENEDINNLNRNVTNNEILKAIKSTGKSVDNCNFHPIMFRNLGKKAISMLQTLFNMCLSKQQWVWEGAEVIFLRKDGKDSYSKPGSYRPICNTSYIGKLLETVIAIRIEQLLLSNNLTDPDQEGFTARKNTIRYLNRLNLGIKVDKENYLTVLCLFVDFEKAFDSVWKRGLIVKIHKLGIRGNVLALINNFLFSRKVMLNINGKCGNLRESAEYGLPQGSVLSPVLFKIYLMDFLSELNQRNDIVVYKFADDGTIKVTAENSQQCVEKLEFIIESLQSWTKKWRMKVNCDRNKTEVICFNTAEKNKSLIPNSFKLGNKEIYKVTKTKVLGLTIDEDLTYLPHSQEILTSLQAKWAKLCKYSNRHWGFNQRVMLYLIKAIFVSKLSYASHIWIKNDNIKEINQLWYHILKSISGAILNISQNIAEVILGIPPIQIQTKVNGIKHFLKIINTPAPKDRLKEFLETTYNEQTKSPAVIHNKYKDIFKFLEWKLNHYPSHYNSEDTNIVEGKIFSQFTKLSAKSCTYTKVIINRYIETVIWKSTLVNQFQLDGYQMAPNPRCDALPIPHNISRKTEILLMSLLYKNNLLNGSLYKLGKVPSPLCSLCAHDEETPEHILFKCSAVQEELRTNALLMYRLANNLEDGDDEDSYIGLLNASRDREFLCACINILNTIDLRVSVDL